MSKDKVRSHATTSATTHHHHYCSKPAMAPKKLQKGISNERAKLILTNSTKWVNGTTLHYYFFNRKTDGQEIELEDGTTGWRKWKGTTAQMNVVRMAFGLWKKTGIGLKFEEVKNREDAEIRIGFMEDDGSWSFVGREILDIDPEERTMNFGWNIAVRDQHNGIGTTIHEIGHTLGMQHEHQNPFAGIVWNKTAVYKSLGGPPNNWDKETTYENIIKKLNKNEVNGSKWDPDSIMHYPFQAGLINKPLKYKQGLQPPGDLSKADIKYILSFYPTADPIKDVAVKESVTYDIVAKNSEQQNFIFKPSITRYYTIHTVGKFDTVMVLSEQSSTKDRLYLSGDDNSGTGQNALIRLKLFRGKTYVINLRVYYKIANAKAALVIS